MDPSGILDPLKSLLGLGETSGDLEFWQMMVRGVICYTVALILIRVGDKRFLGQSTAFDVILGVVLGSIVSRAVTGNSAFFATLIAAGTLVALHWVMAFITFHSDRIGDLAKGTARLLVKDGEIRQDVASKSHISRKDLDQAIRINGGLPDISKIAEAHMERNGNISVIERRGEPRILEVDVKEGVQTIRIQLG
ncbi:MAG: DUF421 domain-containing protein [Chloroflexota bacterium]